MLLHHTAGLGGHRIIVGGQRNTPERVEAAELLQIATKVQVKRGGVDVDVVLNQRPFGGVCGGILTDFSKVSSPSLLTTGTTIKVPVENTFENV